MQMVTTADLAPATWPGAETSWTFEVTERDIRRFLQAIGEPMAEKAAEPSCQGAAPRNGSVRCAVAPPLFFQVMAWEDVDPEQLPADGTPVELKGGPPQGRSMGGSSDYTVFRQVRAGERIRVQSRLEAVEWRSGRQGPLHLIKRQTTFTDEAGRQVARELATYLKRAA